MHWTHVPWWQAVIMGGSSIVVVEVFVQTVNFLIKKKSDK